MRKASTRPASPGPGSEGRGLSGGGSAVRTWAPSTFRARWTGGSGQATWLRCLVVAGWAGERRGTTRALRMGGGRRAEKSWGCGRPEPGGELASSRGGASVSVGMHYCVGASARASSFLDGSALTRPEDTTSTTRCETFADQELGRRTCSGPPRFQPKGSR